MAEESANGRRSLTSRSKLVAEVTLCYQRRNHLGSFNA